MEDNNLRKSSFAVEYHAKVQGCSHDSGNLVLRLCALHAWEQKLSIWETNFKRVHLMNDNNGETCGVLLGEICSVIHAQCSLWQKPIFLIRSQISWGRGNSLPLISCLPWRKTRTIIVLSGPINLFSLVNLPDLIYCIQSHGQLEGQGCTYPGGLVEADVTDRILTSVESIYANTTTPGLMLHMDMWWTHCRPITVRLVTPSAYNPKLIGRYHPCRKH